MALIAQSYAPLTTMVDDSGLKSAAILLLLNADNNDALAASARTAYKSPAASASPAATNKPRRRVRRRYNQILRRFCCSYPQCNKSYGSLNHLNAHIVTKKHGQRKSRADFQFTDQNKFLDRYSVGGPASDLSVSGSRMAAENVQSGWPTRREQASGTYWYGMPVRPTQASDEPPRTPVDAMPAAARRDGTSMPLGSNPFAGGSHSSSGPTATTATFLAIAPGGARYLDPGAAGSSYIPHAPHPQAPPPPPYPGYVLYSPYQGLAPGQPHAWVPQQPPPNILAPLHYLPPARDLRSSSTSSAQLPLRPFLPPIYSTHGYAPTSNPHNITLPPMVANQSGSSLPPLNVRENSPNVSAPADSGSCSPK